MNDTLVCWKCGASLTALSLPFGRSEVCPACRTDLRVCKMCTMFDPARSKQCREPMVDEVHNKERANFCDWFKPRAGAFKARDDAAARAGLDALFGGGSSATSPSTPDQAREELEKLFGKKS